MNLTLGEVRQRQRHPHLAADATYSRLFMRRISPLLTWLIVRFTPLSADAVTLIAIASGVAAAVLVGLAHPIAFAGAIVALQFAFLCDVSDGEVARIRGTASKRGTYYDLIGHGIQDRALWIAAAYQAMVLFDWNVAIVVLMLISITYTESFGLHARTFVMRVVDPDDPVHGMHREIKPPAGFSPVRFAYYCYRRISFIWHYPASMNLFCLAIGADVVRFVAFPGAQPLVLPLFYLGFGPARVLKQFGNALRLMRSADWT